MFLRWARAMLVLTSAFVCGCASTPTDTKPNLVSDMPPPSDNGMVTGAVASNYQLSVAELGYDCRKLTGLMQVRILQMRGYENRRHPSAVARNAQSIATPIFGGTKEGIDPDGQYQRDRAMLEAYNQRLALKDCKTFDIAAELAATTDATPMPKERPRAY
ncbi:MAG TPA: hypothetical protein VNR88_06415 [Hyphomicrobium sp.]|nr:hypothetical protein [Hyphomicrobium sp.]